MTCPHCHGLVVEAVQPCGHSISLLRKSVESDYTHCAFCDVQSMFRDAVNAEKRALERAEQAEAERDAMWRALRAERQEFLDIMEKVLPIAPMTDEDMAWAAGKVQEIKGREATGASGEEG